MAIASLQIVLDKGQEADWFSTWWVTSLAITAAYAFLIWIVWEWYPPNPVVDIRLFKMRNFRHHCHVLQLCSPGIVLFGTTVMIPQFLQVQLGYPAVVAGESLAGGGFIMIMILPFVGQMVSRVDPRKMMAFGFISISAAMYYMSTLVSLTMDFRAAFLMRTLQMFGLAFIFVPQNVLAYVGVPREKNNQISSMNSFMRNVGGSIGIALISTSIARVAQKRRNFMVAHATPGTPQYDSFVAGMSKTLQGQGSGSVDATHKAYGMLSYLIDRQATTIAYVEVISILAIIILSLVPFLLIMKRNKQATAEQTAVH